MTVSPANNTCELLLLVQFVSPRRGAVPRDGKDGRRPVLRHDFRIEGSGYHCKHVAADRPRARTRLLARKNSSARASTVALTMIPSRGPDPGPDGDRSLGPNADLVRTRRVGLIGLPRVIGGQAALHDCY